MYFYIDESGHTGPNLFDPNQPRLYYGVLSSRIDLDDLWIEAVGSLRLLLGGRRLHAAELGDRGLLEVCRELRLIGRAADLQIDIYEVVKPDIAIISFFDQVFDQGLNPAVSWSGYWTPLRFVLLMKVASLFDQDLAERAWAARLDRDKTKATEELAVVCRQLRARVDRLPDNRSRQVVGDALDWARLHAGTLGYSPETKAERLAAMPNVCGFQAVISGISTQLRDTGEEASRIVVDRQSQFNKAQNNLFEYYQSARAGAYSFGIGLPKLDLTHVPKIPLEFVSGNESLGLELADAHLWMFSRARAGYELPQDLQLLMLPPAKGGKYHQVSLEAMQSSWAQYFSDLPEPDEEGLSRARDLIAIDESRRLRAIEKIGVGKPTIDVASGTLEDSKVDTEPME